MSLVQLQTAFYWGFAAVTYLPSFLLYHSTEVAGFLLLHHHLRCLTIQRLSLLRNCPSRLLRPTMTGGNERESASAVAKDVEAGIAYSIEAQNALPMAPNKDTLANEKTENGGGPLRSSSSSTITDAKEDSKESGKRPALKQTVSTISQAEHLGRSKILIIMLSLCVRCDCFTTIVDS